MEVDGQRRGEAQGSHATAPTPTPTPTTTTPGEFGKWGWTES